MATPNPTHQGPGSQGFSRGRGRGRPMLYGSSVRNPPPDRSSAPYTPPAVYGDYSHNLPKKQEPSTLRSEEQETTPVPAQHSDHTSKKQESTQDAAQPSEGITAVALADLLQQNREMTDMITRMMVLNANHGLAIEALAQSIGQQHTVQTLASSLQDTAGPIKETLNEPHSTPPSAERLDEAIQQFVEYLGSRPMLESLAKPLEHEPPQQTLLVGPQQSPQATAGLSEERTQDVGETLKEPRDTRSLLPEAAEDRWKYAKSLFSDRLLRSSNHEDLLIFVTTSARYLEHLEGELAGKYVKQVVVDFVMVMGALTGTLAFRLKLRRRFSPSGLDDIDEPLDESDLEQDSDSDPSEETEAQEPLPVIRELPHFPSVLRLCGDEGDERTQSLYHDDLQDYHQTARREAAELELQIENGQMDALHPFVAIMGHRTEKFIGRIWSRRVVAGIDYWGAGALVVPNMNDMFQIPRGRGF